MKKLFKQLFFLSAITSSLFLASCDDNEEIAVDPDAQFDVVLDLEEGGGGDMASVTVDANTQSTILAKVTFVSTNESMRRLYITQNVAGQGAEPFEIGANIDKKADGSIDIEAANSNGIEYQLELPVPSGVGQGNVVYELWTTTGRGDYRDQSKRLAVGIGEIILEYGGSNPSAEVKSYSAKMFAAPLADGSSETFISLLDGQLFRVDQGVEYAAFWDFGYYYGNTGLASLASTRDYPSSVIDVNAVADAPDDELNTAFFSLSTTTSTQFDAVTVSGDLNFVVKATSQRINNLSEGDIIEFVDHYGKKGLIKVVEIEPGNGTGDFMVIDIKVQP
ncbi:MAG: hypothetical protein ABJH05_06630 [Fulvivirga sp.]